jgi:hypothetical protein
MNTYPALSFAVRNSRSLRPAISFILFLALVYIAFRCSSIEIGVVAVVAAIAVYFLLALAFEILRLIYETLVPQL